MYIYVYLCMSVCLYLCLHLVELEGSVLFEVVSFVQVIGAREGVQRVGLREGMLRLTEGRKRGEEKRREERE